MYIQNPWQFLSISQEEQDLIPVPVAPLIDSHLLEGDGDQSNLVAGLGIYR